VDPSTVAANFIGTAEIWIAAAFKQNGLRRMTAGQPVLVSFPSAPGIVYESEVVAIPPGVVQGQITSDDAADPFQAMTSAQDVYPARIEFPADAPRELGRPGSLVQATVFTDEGNPIYAAGRMSSHRGAPR
jgi:multidrug resistance efflux pump